MTNKRLTLEEYYAIMTAGGRLRGERSRVVESKYYGRHGDPANHVEYEAERARQKKAKKQKKKSKWK